LRTCDRRTRFAGSFVERVEKRSEGLCLAQTPRRAHVRSAIRGSVGPSFQSRATSFSVRRAKLHVPHMLMHINERGNPFKNIHACFLFYLHRIYFYLD
jgi:hypothetical protein